jgi:hypothetical protein
MKKIYEAWQDETCIAFAEQERIKWDKSKGILSEEAKFLHRVEADTWEEAMTIHYQKMGWSPYKPEGEAIECPNNCGATFYPEGSGECPNCGDIC